MTMTMVESPLLRMAQTTPTQYWNDSCATAELTYAVERGAIGATSNPSIVLEVMKKEGDFWAPRVRELADANPTWSEAVSYTHLRAHETDSYLVCRLLLEKQ